MQTDANKELVRRFVEEAQNDKNMAAIDERMAPAFIDHCAVPGFTADREGVRDLFTALHTAFPDFHAAIEHQVAEGEDVVTRKTFTGTHLGELFGVPATGRRVTFGTIDILRVRDGKITDHWNQVDLFGLMQQIGAGKKDSPASAGEDLSAVRGFFSAFSGGADPLEAIVTPDCLQHDPATPLPATGLDGVRVLFAIYRTAFPDLRFTVEEIFGAGDRVVARWRATGTHLGELAGAPATGRRAEITGISLCRMREGRIAESWVNWDTLGLLTQLGLLPAPTGAAAEAATSRADVASN